MQRHQVVKVLEDIEDILIEEASTDNSVTVSLLDEYSIHCWALKSINDSYPFEQALRFQEICDEIKSRLAMPFPNVPDTVIDQYSMYQTLLGICLKEVPRIVN